MKIFCRKVLPILGVIISLCSCKDDTSAVTTATTCAGYIHPYINVFVNESTSTDFIIKNATVMVITNNDNQSESYIAPYIEEGFINAGTTGAYWTSFNVTVDPNYDISLVVSAEGYHTFTTKGISLKAKFDCEVADSINYNVYLCPVGTGCL